MIAAFVANATTAGSVVTSLAIAIGNTLESVVGAYLINRWSSGPNSFTSPAGIGKFAAICVVSTMLSGCIGVVSLSAAGFALWSDFVSIAATWWLGDLAGALVFTPVIVLWSTKGLRLPTRTEFLHSVLALVGAVAVGLIAFSPLLDQTTARVPLAFLAVLPLIWAALRCGPRDTATVILILSSFAVWGTIAGAGPFARGNLNDSILLLITFMIGTALPSLALSAEVAMRDQAVQQLQLVTGELSHRTKNLLSVIQALAQQTAQKSSSFEEFKERFMGRIFALSRSHDLLIKQDWQGANLADVIRVQLEPFVDLDASRTADHGHARDCATYGIGNPRTRHQCLQIWCAIEFRGDDWNSMGDHTAGKQEQLRLRWEERDGPLTQTPIRRGFGSIVLERMAATVFQGNAGLKFEPEGLIWTLEVPVANFVSGTHS